MTNEQKLQLVSELAHNATMALQLHSAAAASLLNEPNEGGVPVSSDTHTTVTEQAVEHKCTPDCVGELEQLVEQAESRANALGTKLFIADGERIAAESEVESLKPILFRAKQFADRVIPDDLSARVREMREQLLRDLETVLGGQDGK